MLKADYEVYPLKFMSHRDIIKYKKGHNFSEEELQQITPEGIAEYFYFRAYIKACLEDNDRPEVIQSYSQENYCLMHFLMITCQEHEK